LNHLDLWIVAKVCPSCNELSEIKKPDGEHQIERAFLPEDWTD
jgi:hypothetical protein